MPDVQEVKATPEPAASAQPAAPPQTVPGETKPPAQPTPEAKTDWRAEFFKQRDQTKKVQTEKTELEKILERSTAAMETIAASLGKKAPEQPKAEPSAGKTDDDWIKQALGLDKPEPAAQPTPAQPEKKYLTAEDMQRVLEERDKKVKEDLRKETAVEQQMGTVVPLLKQLFTGQDGKQDDARIAEAFEVVRNEALRVGYPPMAVATLLFGDKIHERQAAAERAQAKKELDLEYRKTLAERGVNLVSAGLEPPPPPSEEELAQADELKYLQEHQDELRKGEFAMPQRGSVKPRPAPRR